MFRMKEAPRRLFGNVLVIAGVIVVYFVAARIGLSMAFRGTNISPVWPPSGIAMAMVLLFGYSVWPGIAIGAFLANFLTHLPLLTSAFISAGNTLEALGAAYFVRRLVGMTSPLEKPESIFYFLLACMLSSVISATIGTSAVFLSNLTGETSYAYLWSTWWLGDTAGMIIVAPFLLAWSKRAHEENLFSKEPVRALLLLTGSALAGWVIFGGSFSATAPLTYLALPLLIIAAFRYEQRGASAAILLLSALAVWGTRHGYGPFYRNDLNESLLFLQLFMGVIAATSLFVASAVTAQKRDEKIIHAQLKEKGVLLQEVHHRVKNNLQLIVSLLRLQASGADLSTQKFLRESQNRVQSMALIHERLYGRGSISQIDMTLYIHDISSFLISSYSVESDRVKLNIHCQNVFLGIDQAIPCGLIVNEVITNSLKHAFPGKSEGKISIEFSCNDRIYDLKIHDNGIGIKQDKYRSGEAGSLGLRLIELLVDQLGGTVHVESNGGTKFLIQFKSTSDVLIQ